MVDVHFIIVNWNTRQLLLDCIDSIKETVQDLDYCVCVVDNGSSDGSVEAVHRRFPSITVIRNHENRGFAAAVNQALDPDCASYTVLLNTDALLEKGAIHTLYFFMESCKDAGIAGARLHKPDGTAQHSYDNYPTLLTELFNKSLLRLFFPDKYPGKKKFISSPLEVESVIGACMMIRNETIKEVGKLDEDYFFFLEETDWCYRMQKAGRKIYHVPDAIVIHLGGQSKKSAPWQAQIEYCRSLYIFFRKNRSTASYIIFRVCYPLKLLFNLLANLTGNIFVLFSSSKLLYRLMVYYKLIYWHLLLCPEWMGLRPVKR